MLQPSLLLQIVSVLVIALAAAAAGAMSSLVRHSPEWILCLPLIVCAIWIVWIQTLGTFRLHERRANETGNFLIGVAAVSAMAVAAVPMAATMPLDRWTGSISTVAVVSLVLAGALNLRWARQLRADGTAGVAGWTFSIREVMVLTTAMAFGLGGFLMMQNELAVRSKSAKAPRQASTRV